MTAPLSGFSGADEYYARCSAAPQATRIAVPSLVLAAADDPLIPPSILQPLGGHPPVTLEITRHGGHVGFFSRPDRTGDPYWLDRRVIHFVTSAGAPGDPTNSAHHDFPSRTALESPPLPSV